MTKKRRRTREPRVDVIRHDDRLVVRSVVHPGRWKHRQFLVELDARCGMGGKWIEVVDEVFGDAWFSAQADVEHEIAKAMCWPYRHTIWRIADAADLVLAVRRARRGGLSIERRMEVAEDYVATSFEARVARMVGDAGIAFSFGSTKGDGASGDIFVEGATPFVIEVKHKKFAYRASVEDALTSRVAPAFYAVAMGGTLYFDWSGDEVQKIPEGERGDAPFEAVVARAIGALRDAMSTSAPGEAVAVEVPGIGVVGFDPGTADSPDSIRVHGPSPYDRHAARLAKTVLEAGHRQLDAQTTGMLFLCADRLLNELEATVAATSAIFAEHGVRLPHVAGAVVLIVTSGGDGIVEETRPVPNPHARVPLANLRLLEAREPRTRVRFDGLGDPFGKTGFADDPAPAG